MSILCDMKVFMIIVDNKTNQKIMHYQSDPKDDYIGCIMKN